VLVALFHLLPLLLDGWAIRVLFERGAMLGLRDAIITRWAGESANSLLPAGQIGGPVLMTRHLTRRGMGLEDAAAAITVSTTLQTFAQIAFALLGVSLLGAQVAHMSEGTLRTWSLIASGVLAVQVGGFYLLQRRGLFGKLTRAATRFSAKRDWSRWLRQAESIDSAVESTYRRAGPVVASFLLSLVGWVVGSGEVFLILQLLDHPVNWLDALILESLGQAIRGAGFAIPGALGVQEGGYLLLAPLASLPPDTALALSLAKRTREILLGLPGLIYLHIFRLAAPHPPRPPAAPR
jgi:putative membrane protein